MQQWVGAGVTACYSHLKTLFQKLRIYFRRIVQTVTLVK